MSDTKALRLRILITVFWLASIVLLVFNYYGDRPQLPGNTASFEPLTSYVLPFNIKLPEEVSYIKVRLKGIDVKQFELDGDNQKLTGDILEVYRTSVPDSGGEFGYDREIFKEYLSDSFFIKASDPEISSAANIIVGGEKDPLKRARLIYDWVYENIEKTSALTLPTSTEVLKTKRGDCNEHAALYTSLARAVGVPTRTATGLVYKDGSFHYHAWPEVYLGEWVSIDPTLGQWPSDASHIRLITGDFEAQMKLAGAFGKLKVEGLNYR